MGTATLNQCTVDDNAGAAIGGAWVGDGTTLSSTGSYWGDNTPSDVWAAKKTDSYNGWVTFECNDDGCS